MTTDSMEKLLAEHVMANKERYYRLAYSYVRNPEDALEALPANYHCIVILRYFEDLKIEEIAGILDENVNTVKTRLYKSLKKLRIKIEEA